MHVELTQILVICVVAGLCWYVNAMLNPVAVLNKVVSVVIVIVAVLLLLQSLGLMNSGVTVNR